MQILGLTLLGFVVWYGFDERDTTTISAFDFHAMVMVLGGSIAAVLVSSTTRTSINTLTALVEIIPGVARFAPATERLEADRVELSQLWLDGKRAQAAELAGRSEFPVIARMLDLVIERAPSEAISSAFIELRHAEMSRWQPPISNWELMAKLGPSFGMVGTITGMIQMFRTMGDGTNMGASISLALLATLYGMAFGAGVAGPIGHLLRGHLDERLGAMERCEHTVAELIARSSRAAMGA